MINKFMKNKNFDKIKKTFAVLLAFCFVLSVTAAAASAADNSKNKDGYGDGYAKGQKDGKNQGKKDCEKYGSREILSKIPSPFNEYGWTKYYRDSYNRGYEKGYLDSYNINRYLCLK